jgi:hypothetical protein
VRQRRLIMFCFVKIDGDLAVEPELWRGAESLAKSKRGGRRGATFSRFTGQACRDSHVFLPLLLGDHHAEARRGVSLSCQVCVI